MQSRIICTHAEREREREYNSVGRTTGKSLLMDMFFDEAKSRIPHLPARRVHFHDFMASVHQAIHDRKHTRKGSLGAVRDVGMEMAAESRLLCFDEFQVLCRAPCIPLEPSQRLLVCGAHFLAESKAKNASRHVCTCIITFLDACRRMHVL